MYQNYNTMETALTLQLDFTIRMIMKPASLAVLSILFLRNFFLKRRLIRDALPFIPPCF